MAENKKSFIAYSDWNGMFQKLPDEVAGKLIKHIFLYVNDENPISDDYIINALFEQIKSTLKRDLVKWEEQREQRSNAGKKSAEQRATKFNERSTGVNEIERNPTVSVSDSVNVSVNDSVLLKKETKNNISFNFKNSLIDYGFDENLINDWIVVRKNKKASNTKTAFDNFITEIEKRNCNLNETLSIIVTNSWSGFKWSWVDNLKNNTKNGESKSNAEIFRDAVTSELGKNFRY